MCLTLPVGDAVCLRLHDMPRKYVSELPKHVEQGFSKPSYGKRMPRATEGCKMRLAARGFQDRDLS